MIQCFKFQVQPRKLINKITRHALHCIRYFFTEIKSIETDALILLLAYIATKLVSNIDSFNLYFKPITLNPTWYNIFLLKQHLTIDVCKALPYFYAFTQCDTVSSLNEKDKCTFYQKQFDKNIHQAWKHARIN